MVSSAFHRVVPLLLCAGLAMAQAKQAPPLALARQAYNDKQYDDAIRLAGEARASFVDKPAAEVVLARAHLARYKLSSQIADLTAAREALKLVDAAALDERDQVELLIAFGISLYLDDQSTFGDRFSAAAEQFEIARRRASLLDARSRDSLFEWWAGALSRQAQQGLDGGGRLLYERILAGAEKELSIDPDSASASYWLAAASRGIGDLTRATGAAVAGWIRAGSLGSRGVALRADLDRLMSQMVLPERARELAWNADPRQALTLLEQQWRELKEKWED